VQHCYADGIADRNRPANLPLAPPPFTLKDIKAAIPAHCFERSAARSLMHLAQDLIMIAIIGYLGTFIPSISAKVPFFGALILWPVYWYVQGSVMTGVWVLAHECGHQAFSDSEALNNFVGTICHSLLLVPYHGTSFCVFVDV
jgi:omega-6 fatty acid desaturase (delta-12 desaturase)